MAGPTLKIVVQILQFALITNWPKSCRLHGLKHMLFDNICTPRKFARRLWETLQSHPVFYLMMYACSQPVFQVKPKFIPLPSGQAALPSSRIVIFFAHIPNSLSSCSINALPMTHPTSTTYLLKQLKIIRLLTNTCL